MNDDPYANGILGAPQVVERCPITGRIYESGSGALSHAEQSAMFRQEAAIAADMPKEGEVCAQTGRPFEVCAPRGGPRWLETKQAQTQRFLAEAPPDFKSQRRADFEAFRDLEPQGRA
jgi:hypothetical protein